MNELQTAEKNVPEKQATESVDQSTIANARESEERASGFYSAADEPKANGKSQRVRGTFRKRGPIVAIVMSLFGLGGLMGVTQLFQPFSLFAQLQETRNSMHYSANMRSGTFFDKQMDSGRVKNPIKGKIFGSAKFKITDSQATKLAVQGIEYDDDFNGTGMRVLKFDDGTGEIRIVAASDKAVSQLNSMNLKGIDASYNAEAISFKNLYNSNSDFSNGYNKGSMTWRGAIANWFGRTTVSFLNSNKITRNLFGDFIQRVNSSESGNTRTVALEMMSRGTEDIVDGGATYRNINEEQEAQTDGKDSNGNPIYKRDSEGNILYNTFYRTEAEPTVSSSTTFDRNNLRTIEGVRQALDTVAKKYGKAEAGAGVAQQVANWGCLGLNVLGGVSLLVSASEALQIIRLATSYFEVVDKVKAGYGDEAPFHELMGALNESKTTNYQVFKDSTSIDMAIKRDDPNLASETTKPITKTAMESSGVVSLYGGGPIDTSDPSVKSFNFTGSIKNILGGVSTGMGAFTACAFTKLAANAASATIGTVKAFSCFLGVLAAVPTVGASTAACGPLLADLLSGAALAVAASVAITGIIKIITPVAAKALTRDLIQDIGGQDLGNAIVSGANMYLGNTHRANGGSLATASKYTEFAYQQQQIIAEDAKFERMTRSPFDVTSQYTFLGSLLRQVMSLATPHSFMGLLTTGSTVMSSSLVSMSPSASAFDIALDLPDPDEYAENCPYLASIGAVGDAFCNPYAVTDISTMNADPLDVIDVLNDTENGGANSNFLPEETSDGNVIIAADSDLAKYILFCNNRTSAFGIADQNIVNEVSDWGQVSGKFSNQVNAAIGSIPIVGDIIDVVDNSQALLNAGYIGGESCVAGNNVSSDFSESPNWEKAKWYQRFIEDQSLAETIGLFGTDGGSAVSVFLDNYYKENPLDNSYEGILARYSGLDKETTVALINIINYGDFIANYHPEERYAFEGTSTDEVHEIKFDNQNQIAKEPFILLYQISYADVRNRNFVA